MATESPRARNAGPGDARIPWSLLGRHTGQTAARAASGTGFTGLRHPNRGQICRNCVKLRLTIPLPVGGDLSEPHAGPTAAGSTLSAAFRYNDLTGRPEEAPNPSIRASVSSSEVSLALTSH